MRTTTPNNTFSLDKRKIFLKENLVPKTPSITVSKDDGMLITETQ